MANLKDVECIRQDVYQCTTTGGLTAIFNGKKCKKIPKKAKTCALNSGNDGASAGKGNNTKNNNNGGNKNSKKKKSKKG